jgi:CheY-like chemotaxis protein
MQNHDTILLVDDDPSIRRGAARILRLQGYNVLEACDGFEALRVAHEYEGSIDLLLTDIVMPQMRGDELAARMRTSFPCTKVLLASANAYPRDLGDDMDDVAFLTKPFGIDSLTSKVREVMESEPDTLIARHAMRG